MRSTVIDAADSVISKVNDSTQAMVMPTFTFLTKMGQVPIDEIQTDFILVPMLQGMKVHEALRVRDQEIGEQVRAVIKESSFEGKRGTHLAVLTSLPGKKADSKRWVFLAGLGEFHCYGPRTVNEVFESMLREALERKVECITIPFVSNRGTSNCLNHGATAYHLKTAVHKVIAEYPPQQVELKNIQIFCAPQAKSHIRQGLNLPLKENKPCPGRDGCHKCATK